MYGIRIYNSHISLISLSISPIYGSVYGIEVIEAVEVVALSKVTLPMVAPCSVVGQVAVPNVALVALTGIIGGSGHDSF